MSTTTLSHGQSQAVSCTITSLHLPHAPIFADRAHRCQVLAKDNPFARQLTFCAALAKQQDLEFQQFPSLPLPDEPLLQHCQKYEIPPLSPAGWPPHPHWQELVHRLIRATAPELSQKDQQALQRCPTTDISWLDLQKSHLLGGNRQLLEPMIIPIISGALQVQWSSLAARLSMQGLRSASQHSRCPVCGSLPVAATCGLTETTTHSRDLHCSLCNSVWKIDANTCSTCGSNEGLDTQNSCEHLPHVQAEICHYCRSYLKRINNDLAVEAEPVADDLASMELDRRMLAKGLSRSGVNLLLLPQV
nr:formate dehydrogenase accessory protein FdhE [uncultured Desulfobulbus sp.]